MDTTSYGLLKTLEITPGLSQRDLAKQLGVSLGKVNSCLNPLIDKGCLKADNFRNRGNKLVYAYLLTPHGIEQKTRMTVEFLQINLHEYEKLRAEIEEMERETEQTEGPLHE